MSMKLGGLPFRVCLYFACAPDEELSALDIQEKFDVKEVKYANQTLQSVVEAGYLTKDSGDSTPGRFAMYRAGLLLLRMLGRTVK